ncbi:MAG: YIP1 family protein [Myxococcaceae bacterium]|nr:YIP1 family protein [Myxococcaceae bacterium]
MEARCPGCSTIFPTRRTGLQFCPACGQQVWVADVDPPPASGDGAGAPPPSGSGPGAPPPPGSPALLLGRAPTAWERRAELGAWTGLWRTWKEVLFAPEAFWKTLRPDGPAQDALFFGWLVAIAGAVIQAPLLALQIAGHWEEFRELFSTLSSHPADWRGDLDRLFSSGSSLVMVLILVAGLVAYPLSAVVTAAINHLFCLLFGAGKYGFWATFRVVAYASAPLVFSAIPVVGSLAGMWGLVLTAWGLARIQETTVGRAAAAVFALQVALCCCVCGGLGFGLSAVLASFT